MSIDVICPQCGIKLKAPAEAAGKTATCKACGGKLTVPNAQSFSQLAPPTITAASAIATHDDEILLWEWIKKFFRMLCIPIAKFGTAFGRGARAVWQSWRNQSSSENAIATSEQTPATSALMECPDCKQKHSRRASVCPHCGCPVAAVLKKSRRKDKSTIYFGIGLVLLLAFGVWMFAVSQSNQPVGTGMIKWIVIAIVAAVYFAPSLAAWDNEHKHTSAIVALNLLLGWTFIGWVIAMVWALTAEKSA